MNKKTRLVLERSLVILFVTCFIGLHAYVLFVLFASYTGIMRDSNNTIQVNHEEDYRDMSLLKKAHYGGRLDFQFQIIRDGERQIRVGQIIVWTLDPSSSMFYNPFYTDVVFVHTEEDALGFPDNVIVGWPRMAPGTERMVDGINQRVNLRSSITFEEFGLTDPITVADLVDNWEKVGELMVALGMFHWWGTPF